MPNTSLLTETIELVPEIRMSKYRAEAYIRRYGAQEVIADIYMDDEMLQSALITTIADFEYPNWSHKTIDDVLKRYYPNI